MLSHHAAPQEPPPEMWKEKLMSNSRSGTLTPISFTTGLLRAAVVCSSQLYRTQAAPTEAQDPYPGLRSRELPPARSELLPPSCSFFSSLWFDLSFHFFSFNTVHGSTHLIGHALDNIISHGLSISGCETSESVISYHFPIMLEFSATPPASRPATLHCCFYGFTVLCFQLTWSKWVLYLFPRHVFDSCRLHCSFLV